MCRRKSQGKSGWLSNLCWQVLPGNKSLLWFVTSVRDPCLVNLNFCATDIFPSHLCGTPTQWFMDYTQSADLSLKIIAYKELLLVFSANLQRIYWIMWITLTFQLLVAVQNKDPATSLALLLLQSKTMYDCKLVNPNDFPVHSSWRSSSLVSVAVLRGTVALLCTRRLYCSSPEVLCKLYYFIILSRRRLQSWRTERCLRRWRGPLGNVEKRVRRHTTADYFRMHFSKVH